MLASARWTICDRSTSTCQPPSVRHGRGQMEHAELTPLPRVFGRLRQAVRITRAARPRRARISGRRLRTRSGKERRKRNRGDSAPACVAIDTAKVYKPVRRLRYDGLVEGNSTSAYRALGERFRLFRIVRIRRCVHDFRSSLKVRPSSYRGPCTTASARRGGNTR